MVAYEDCDGVCESSLKKHRVELVERDVVYILSAIDDIAEVADTVNSRFNQLRKEYSLIELIEVL